MSNNQTPITTMTFKPRPLSELIPIIPVSGVYPSADNVAKEHIFARLAIQNGKMCTMKHSSQALRAAGVEIGTQSSWYTHKTSSKGKIQDFLVCKFDSDEGALRTNITGKDDGLTFGSTGLMRAFLKEALGGEVDVTKIDLSKDFKSPSIQIPLGICAWGKDSDSIPYVAINKDYVLCNLRDRYKVESGTISSADGTLSCYVTTNQ